MLYLYISIWKTIRYGTHCWGGRGANPSTPTPPRIYMYIYIYISTHAAHVVGIFIYLVKGHSPVSSELLHLTCCKSGIKCLHTGFRNVASLTARCDVHMRTQWRNLSCVSKTSQSKRTAPHMRLAWWGYLPHARAHRGGTLLALVTALISTICIIIYNNIYIYIYIYIYI